MSPCLGLSVLEGFSPSKSLMTGGSWTAVDGIVSGRLFVVSTIEFSIRVHGSVWFLCPKNSGIILTKFRFFMVFIPIIKSISESSAMRTGREKMYFKESFLNDTTISSTDLDSIHLLSKPEQIHIGESESRKRCSPRRPSRTLRLMTSPTSHPVSIWASASMPLL